MQTITINPFSFNKCKWFTDYVNRTGGVKKHMDEIYKACVFIYSIPGAMVYFASNGQRVLEITAPSEQDLGPHPIAIDAHNMSDVSGTELEIPDCTWETFRAANDPARPEWLKPEDLTTSRVRVGGKTAGLIYVDVPNYKPIMSIPKAGREFSEFYWNKKLHKPHTAEDCKYNECKRGAGDLKSCDFDDDFQFIQPIVEGNHYRPWEEKKCFYYNPVFPDSIHIVEKEEKAAPPEFGEDEVLQVEYKTFQLPFAKWERTDCNGIKTKLVIMGRSKEKN
ncbi:MAG: hypothetical protein LBG89_03965 [Rickettsiales bacterium]|jgi:hypothetical protein|nr:hypothetical protein [Rickettsiales bacterium]